MSIGIDAIEKKLQNNQEIDPYDEILVAEVLNEIINRAQGIMISKIYEINNDNDDDDDDDKNYLILRNEISKYMKMRPALVENVKENIETIKILREKIKNENHFLAEIGVR